MEAIVRTSGLASLREQTTLFVLSTTEAEAMMMQAIRDALTKASLPQVRKTDLPMVSQLCSIISHCVSLHDLD